MDKQTLMQIQSSSQLNSETQQIFEKFGRTRNFSKDEIIYRQGDVATTFCYLKKGKIKVYMTSIDGMEKTLNTASQGEILGEGAFFDKKPRVSSAKALTDCEVLMIDEKTLTELFSKHSHLAFELLEILANRIRLLSSQLDSITFMQADARIVKFLLENEKDLRVSLSHEEIANAVGVSRVTVSKILSRFVQKGYLATEYRQIIIKDKKALVDKENSL